MSLINVIDIEIDGFHGDILDVSVCSVDIKTMNIKDNKVFMTNDYDNISELFEYMKREYKLDKRPWLSWSKYDQKITKDLCDKLSIDYPLSDKCIDVHELFEMYLIKHKKIRGEYMVSFLTSAKSLFNINGNDIEAIISVFQRLLSINAYNTIYESGY